MAITVKLDDLLHDRYIVVRKGPRGVHVLRTARV